jgi:hypothetical protein
MCRLSLPGALSHGYANPTSKITNQQIIARCEPDPKCEYGPL